MEGYRLAGKSLHGRETMMAFRRNLGAGARDDPWPAIRFSEGRALWRDSLTLLPLRRPPYAEPRNAALAVGPRLRGNHSPQEHRASGRVRTCRKAGQAAFLAA